MSANDPGFILFGQKMSAPQIPVTSSPIPSNAPPQNDWSSSKKSEIGLSSTENTEQQRQNDRPKNETTKTSNTEEFKMMKKPEKIQQCPRCNSMDTKFCYFNNYNVNQPRHFCKTCHRYWTAGGAMRNVPVGAGRRRNRQLSSPYHRHTTTTVSSEGISVPNQNADSPSSHQHFTTLESSPPENNNTSTTVLRFGPEDPVSESASSALTNNASGGGARGNEVSEIAMQWNRGVSNLMNTSNGVRCYPAAPWVFPAQWFDKIGSPNIPLQFVACWSNGTGISIAPNGCLSSSTSNDPSLEKH